MESIGEFEYNTKDLIGHGAFAVVFKGRYKKKNDLVAIKSITKKNLAKSQNLLGKEIKILKELAELHHENVVALLDCKETATHVFLVMEYCNGGDLADYLHAKGTLSEDTIRSFLRQIAGAMKALNAKGIVHRDLKPQNILLCHSGKSNPSPNEITLKIADFGFARFLQDGVMAATLCGSPMYMAPEVIMSLQYDAKADLWSIGTIVFQCLTGKAPFQAQTPQALKQFYEKNANLVPRIPNGTSPELTELLMRLLRRNAKDRMEFDEFFNHPFLKNKTRTSSPVPVPNRRSLSPELSSPVSPYGSPSPQGWSREAGGEEMALSPMAASPLSEARSPPPAKNGSSSSSPVEQGFVVVPSSLPEGQNYDQQKRRESLKRQQSDACGSPSKIPVCSNSPKKILDNINLNLTKGIAAYSPSKSVESSSRPSTLPVITSSNTSTATTTLTTTTAATTIAYQPSDPIPVPSQKEAYEQIQRSLQDSPSSSPRSVGGRIRTSSPLSSPISSKPHLPHSDSVLLRRDSTSSQSSETSKILTDISSLSPPTVQFTIGTPPTGGRLRNYSGGTPPTCGRQTPTNWRQQLTPPPSSIPGSPLRRSSGAVAAPPVTGCIPFAITNPLSPILASPQGELSSFRCHTEPSLATLRGLDCRNVNNAPCPLRMAFGGRTMTLPEIYSKDLWPGGTAIREQSDSSLQRSGSSGRLSDHRGSFVYSCGGVSHSPPTAIMPYNHTHHQCWMGAAWDSNSSPGRVRRGSTGYTGGFTESSPTCPTFLSFGTSPPNMEGPVVFVAPDLPEETLMEKEHSETLAKLNFVLALVDCILDLAKSKSTPLSALTDSFSLKENLDQISIASDGYRKAEQLVLYMRALQLLSSSLQLSRQEVQAGRLQPSTSVRNVLQTMKEHYHNCLSMCKSLNTPGILQAAGVDPSSSNITADRLIYNYAIEMCQSAALDELFGNSQECFRRYQTAQILLHSLAQQVKHEDDKKLLSKYKNAVERRLYVLQSQGYVYAYDTT